MTPARLLYELETLASRLGIVVRIEPFGGGMLEGRGGLCRVRGKAVVVMDSALSVAERSAMLARALAAFELGEIYVPPLVRTRIESQIPNRSRFARTKAT